MEGGLAIAVLIIVGFVGFVLWAKTPRGRQVLEEAFGAPDSAKKPVKRRPATRKRASSAATRSKSTSAAKKPSRR